MKNETTLNGTIAILTIQKKQKIIQNKQIKIRTRFLILVRATATQAVVGGTLFGQN